MNPDPNPDSAQSPVQTRHPAPQTEKDPTTDQTGGPVLAPSKHPVQSPAEFQTNPAMNPVNVSLPSPGSKLPNLGNDSAQSPGLGPTDVSYPVQIKNLDHNQTIVLTKPSGPEQTPAQSIVVRVPAMALLKALVQNSGQTHVRIPLQSQGHGTVLVPSTAPSNIHLTASVQSLIQHPGVVQNKVQSPGIVLSPIINSVPVPNLVQTPGLVQNRVLSPRKNPDPVSNPLRSPGFAKKQMFMSFPNPAPVPVQMKSSVTSEARAAPGKDKPAVSTDPRLVRVPLPPDAVRPLSPPPKTTPLKPSVPPLGFRLNGKLIPMLPGVEGGLELSLRAHPSGSKSRLTSVHLTKTPAPVVFPDAPRPSIRLPRPFLTVAREPPQKRTLPPPPKIRPPPKPKPRPHVTLPRPRPEKSKADVVAAFVQKGEVSNRRPPNCTVCMSPYKPVPELRGFVCMCSSDISSALQILKLRRKDERVKSRLKEKLNLINQKRRVSKPQPFHSYAASKNLSSLQKPLRATEHFLSEPRPSVTPGLSRPRPSVSPGVPRPRPSPSPGALVRSEVSSPGGGAEVTVGGAVGRLVIRLEDFYYGCAEGEGAVEQVRLVTTYRCMHCAQVLPNNVSMMQHTRDHMKEHFRGYCPHCFRQFFSSLKLQHHLEVVHGPDSCSSRVVCRICEIEFEDEVSLLLHMKDFHKPGEMPYACALCGFRSSFFSQTWRHFEEVHANTRHFLCQYCLRVFKMERSYQQHVARHLRKQVYSCDRCRLHFHVAKDRQDHQEQHHGTHVRPAQLSGLRPGTTVSVRTFQVAPPESPMQTKPIATLAKTVLKVHPKQQKACKRSAVESLGQLLAQLHSPESSQCVECLSGFQDFQSHFPTRVTCARCHFQTCCSRAYANHMIDNHSGKRSCPLYPQVFASSPRLDCNLECLTCGFSCQTGDAMARHLSNKTKHTCLLTDRAEEELYEEEDPSSVVGRGGFVSIEQLSSSHLSITTLDRPARLSSLAAMTITVRGSSHTPAKPAAPLAVSRLSVLLHSLLHGAVSASKLFGVMPSLIGQWAREQRKTLTNRRWCWDTTAGARWVLTEREQNHVVTLEAILDLCRRTLGTKAPLQARLNWAVDFLLRHDLGVETRSKELRDIGYSVVTSTWDKVSSLALLPPRFCCLDEFPVFMDTTTLSSLAPDALRVWGSREELPLVEVLLCGTYEGSLLPPMLFYNKDLPPLPHGFPTNIILHARDGGYSPGERAQLWTEQVWLPHLRDSAPSLVLLDEHCGHMTPDFTEPLRRSNTELVYIPQGCSFLVQPLDQCVAPVVREFLKVRWSQLVSQSPDCNESDLILTLACWFSEVSHILNTDKTFIHRSFLCMGIRYKTAEVSHHALNQSLHQALIQTAPPVSTVSQSEGAEECEEEGLQAEGQWRDGQECERTEKNQSERLTVTMVGLRTESQSHLQEQVNGPEVMEVDLSEAREGTEEAGLESEGQSEVQEGTEEAGLESEGQSEVQEGTEEAGLESEGQSEVQEGTEEAGLESEGQSEVQEGTQEAGLESEGQSEVQEGTEEAGLESEGQSEVQEGMEEAGLESEGQSEVQEDL